MTSTPNPSNAPISHPAYTILARAHNPEQATQTFTNKIKNKPLLLTTTTTHSGTTDKRALRRKVRERKKQYFRQHQKPRPLSAKEKRELKLHDLKDEEIRYEIYQGLNELWKGYILEVLGFTRDGALVADAGKRVVTQASQGSLLASADFHGMEIEVVRCKDPGRVGLKGIVVRETKGTLLVVTPADQQRTVLKRGAVFRVVVDLPRDGDSTDKPDDGERTGVGRRLVFDLHGDQLEVRPVERAVRKFKWHPMDHL